MARQPLALLAVLTVAGRKGASREKLISLFWPDREPHNARHLLSNTLYVIRKALGEDSVQAVGECIRLNRGVVTSDVWAFEQALEEDDLEHATSLYEGPFLDGFYIEDGGDFDHWVEPVRQRLARRYAEALEERAEQAESEGDCRAAVSWWQLLNEEDPYNSRYAVRYMLALAAARDPANAFMFAEEFERRLGEDLGMKPDPEIWALAQHLRQEPMPTGVEAAQTATRPVTVTTEREVPSSSTGVAEAALPERTNSVRAAQSRPVMYAAAIVAVLVATWLVMRLQDTQQMFSLPGADSTGVAEDALALKVAAAEPRDRIVLADFSDGGSGSELGLIVTETLRIGLAQSHEFALLEGHQLQLALRRMQMDPDSVLGATAARQLARREGLQAFITGAVSESDEGHQITARVVSALSGDVIFDTREVALDSTGIIAAVGRLSRNLREGAGEPLREVERSAPLPRVTTSSLEALRLYSEGVRARWSGHPTRARYLLEEAVTIDTAFAMAHAKLAIFESGLGRSDRVNKLTRAFALCANLPPRERQFISLLYEYIVRRDVDEAIRSARTLVNDYPDDYSGLNWLANFYAVTRKLVLAEFYYRRAIALDSSNVRGYQNAILLQLMLDRLDDAEFTHERMMARAPDHPWTWQLAAVLARFSGNNAAANAHLKSVLHLPALDVSDRLHTLRQLGAVSRIDGDIFASEQYLLDAVEVNVERNWAAGCLSHVVPMALADIHLREEPERGRLRIDRALERCPLSYIEPEERPYALLAQVYAAAAVPDRASELLTDFETARPLELRQWREALEYRKARAELSIAEARPADAIREARLIEDQRLCAHNLCELNAFILMARAFDLAGQPDSALVYYERYVHAPGYIRMWPDSYWLGPTYERLAALHAERGNAETEARYLSLFVDLWEDADAELQPRVEEARRRLGDLESGGVPLDAPAGR